MKCAVAIVLALIGMVVCNPVPSGYGYGYGSPLLLPSAVSVSSSVINHGVPVVKVAPVVKVIPQVIPQIIPVVKAIPYAPITWSGLNYGYGLGNGWGYH